MLRIVNERLTLILLINFYQLCCLLLFDVLYVFFIFWYPFRPANTKTTYHVDFIHDLSKLFFATHLENPENNCQHENWDSFTFSKKRASSDEIAGALLNRIRAHHAASQSANWTIRTGEHFTPTVPGRCSKCTWGNHRPDPVVANVAPPTWKLLEWRLHLVPNFFFPRDWWNGGI